MPGPQAAAKRPPSIGAAGRGFGAKRHQHTESSKQLPERVGEKRLDAFRRDDDGVRAAKRAQHKALVIVRAVGGHSGPEDREDGRVSCHTVHGSGHLKLLPSKMVVAVEQVARASMTDVDRVTCSPSTRRRSCRRASVRVAAGGGGEARSHWAAGR